MQVKEGFSGAKNSLLWDGGLLGLEVGRRLVLFLSACWVITVTMWKLGSEMTLEHCFDYNNSDKFYQSIVSVIENSELDGCHIMASSNITFIIYLLIYFMNICVRSLGARVIGSYELPGVDAWEPNSAPL